MGTEDMAVTQEIHIKINNVQKIYSTASRKHFHYQPFPVSSYLSSSCVILLPPFSRDRKLSTQIYNLMADLPQLPKTKAYKGTDLKKKKIRGTFH